jgi:hypothetical protein
MCNVPAREEAERSPVKPRPHASESRLETCFCSILSPDVKLDTIEGFDVRLPVHPSLGRERRGGCGGITAVCGSEPIDPKRRHLSGPYVGRYPVIG